MVKRRIKKVVALLMAVIITLLCASCGSSKSDPTVEKIYYSLDDEPITLDPQVAEDDNSKLLIMNLFEGLIRLDENGEPSKGAAVSWDISEDEKTYTFSLRKGICWHDGKAVTADDFVYGMQRAVDKNTGSATAKTLFCIKNAQKINAGRLSVEELGVTAPDKDTVVIELENRDDDFLTLLATPAAMPCRRDFFETTRGQYGREADMLMSNGPFRIRAAYGWAHNNYIYLRRNEFYKGERAVVPFGVDITLGKGYNDVAESIVNGELDAAALPGRSLSTAEDNGLHITMYSDTVIALCLNLNSDICKNKNLRMAFLTSFDRSYILSQLPKNATAANDLIGDYAVLEGENYRELAGGDFYLKQSAQAKKFMNKGLKELGLTAVPAISVLCSEDEDIQTVVTNLLQSWNNNMGYYFNKNPVSSGTLDYYVGEGSYDIAVVPIRAKGSAPLDFLESYRRGEEGNIINLNSSAYDKVLSAIENEPGKESLQNYIKLEKYLNEQAVLYPIYFESRYFATAKNVTGIIFHEYNGGVDFIGATKLVAE